MNLLSLHALFMATALVLVHAQAARWGARAQNLVVLLGALLFGASVDVRLALVPFAVMGMQYYFALRMAQPGAQRRAWCLIAAVAALTPLFGFKYWTLFLNLGADAAGLPALAEPATLWVPLGVSYFCLQGLAYTVDVYRGHREPERDPLSFLAFGAFFPSLVAGPISRAAELLPQLQVVRRTTPEALEAGLLLISWGLFKKRVVADQLAPISDRVFALEAASFPLMAVGAYTFTLQLYADFSAYTDIARGLARLLGVDLPHNFRAPLLAESFTDHWQRWHMSLTRFFRDYVYFPLAGERSGALRRSCALLLTFVVSGLWHGAAWNFALWGAYHGAWVLFERALGSGGIGTRRWLRPFRIGFTFTLLCVGMVIFREGDGLSRIVQDLTYDPREAQPLDWAVAGYLLPIVLAWSAPVWLVELGTHRGIGLPRGWARAGVILLLIALTRVLAAPEGESFIYAEF